MHTATFSHALQLTLSACVLCLVQLLTCGRRPWGTARKILGLAPDATTDALLVKVMQVVHWHDRFLCSDASALLCRTFGSGACICWQLGH
jgi:hypothetical protein